MALDMSGPPRGHLHCGRLALKDGTCRNRVAALGPDPATPLHPRTFPPRTFPPAPTAQWGRTCARSVVGKLAPAGASAPGAAPPALALPPAHSPQLPASVTSLFCPTTPGVKRLSPARWPGDGSRGTRTAVAMGSVVDAMLPPSLISPGCKWGDVGWAEALVTVGMGQPGGQGSHRDQTLLLGPISPGCGCPCHLSSQSLHHWLTLSPGWWPPWDAQLYLKPPALQRLCCGTPGRGGPGTSACPSPRLVLPPAPHASCQTQWLVVLALCPHVPRKPLAAAWHPPLATPFLAPSGSVATGPGPGAGLGPGTATSPPGQHPGWGC